MDMDDGPAGGIGTRSADPKMGLRPRFREQAWPAGTSSPRPRGIRGESLIVLANCVVPFY